jgi:uncharacterized integral membrane protein
LYRISFIIVIILALAFGLLLGALNSEAVSLDLLWVQITWPLGLLILSALVAGLLLGQCLAWFFSILPLRVQLRAQMRKAGNLDQHKPDRSLKDNNA